MQNVLQPSNTVNAPRSNEDFINQMCNALLHTTNPDNVARGNAENYMKQAQTINGCVPNLLQIATNQEVSIQELSLHFDFPETALLTELIA